MNLSPELYNAGQANLSVQPYVPVKNATIPYPVNSFPLVLQNVIQALHNNTQIPLELIGNVVLASTSLTCQSLIEVIPPHTNMPEPCSLYLMTIAESGEGKTTINKQVMKPCYAFAAELILQYDRQFVDYKRNHKLWRIRQQALESNLRQAIRKNYSGEFEEAEINKHSQNEPLRPARPNFIYEDSSFKALVEGLSEHPEAGFISDEAITFFKGYLKNNPGLLNKAWDGGVFDYHRAYGEIYQITPRLTFSLMSQPGVFIDYIKKHHISAKDSGFMSRFLFTWVESSIGSRHNNCQKTNSEQELTVFHKRIEKLLALNQIQLSNPNASKKQLTLTNEALILWESNRKETERKMSPGNEWEHIRDIASKASANTLRMAALLAYFEDEDIEEIGSNPISSTINIMNWYLNQASQLFYPMSERFQFEQDVRELYTWIINRIKQNNGYPILKNELEKLGPHRLRRTYKLTPVLDQLISQGYLGVIQMFTHSAQYVTLLYNGHFTIPQGYEFNPQFIVVQSPHNTKGRSYAVPII
ncbi:YfjI family protein [Hafnia paralvei]|uniref:YfjI family protein n=1 Tax=Hafnia paralvei TaxID=546367 RepID=UPI0010347BF9|nr:YfjI family protein [Hafnia paralvei]TBL64574.1 DUF3987 domain-containing protein [Hafnia paralvei]